MLDEILKFHEINFGKPEVTVRAPGRINIIGEHTDYNNGFVFPAAIDRDMFFTISKSERKETQVHSFNQNQLLQFNPFNPVGNNFGWTKYIIGVVEVLKSNGYTIPAFDCTFGGNIPMGSGLSSSAALECGFIKALDKLFNLEIPNEELIYYAQTAEHEYAGVLCGIMDQFAVTFAKQGHATLLDCRSMDFVQYQIDMSKYAILLVNSGVEHNLASTEYNKRRVECNSAVKLISKSYLNVTSLRDATLEMLRTVELPEVISKRAKYVVEENQRVNDVAQSLKQHDIDNVGRLMYKSHKGLKEEYQVSCEELDFLVDSTLDQSGVVGSRMMGGGFGGCTINLVKRTEVEIIEEAIKIKFKKKYNRIPETHIVSLVDGVSIIR